MYKNKHLVVFDGIFRTPFCFLDEEPAWLKIFSNFHDIGLDYGYACICRKYQVGNQFRKTPKWFWVLEENDLKKKKSWKWRASECFNIPSSVNSQIKVFVEDIPVKALMPNLVLLYQKTLLLQEQYLDAILFFLDKRPAWLKTFSTMSEKFASARTSPPIPNGPHW